MTLPKVYMKEQPIGGKFEIHLTSDRNTTNPYLVDGSEKTFVDSKLDTTYISGGK